MNTIIPASTVQEVREVVPAILSIVLFVFTTACQTPYVSYYEATTMEATGKPYGEVQSDGTVKPIPYTQPPRPFPLLQPLTPITVNPPNIQQSYWENSYRMAPRQTYCQSLVNGNFITTTCQ